MFLLIISVLNVHITFLNGHDYSGQTCFAAYLRNISNISSPSILSAFPFSSLPSSPKATLFVNITTVGSSSLLRYSCDSPKCIRPIPSTLASTVSVSISTWPCSLVHILLIVSTVRSFVLLTHVVPFPRTCTFFVVYTPPSPSHVYLLSLC